jgi:hypothetical protein
MRFLFPYSDSLPNGRVTVEDDGATEPGCLVEFSDGTTVLSASRRDKETSLSTSRTIAPPKARA